jgi:hypothetical protein
MPTEPIRLWLTALGRVENFMTKMLGRYNLDKSSETLSALPEIIKAKIYKLLFCNKSKQS